MTKTIYTISHSDKEVKTAEINIIKETTNRIYFKKDEVIGEVGVYAYHDYKLDLYYINKKEMYEDLYEATTALIAKINNWLQWEVERYRAAGEHIQLLREKMKEAING